MRRSTIALALGCGLGAIGSVGCSAKPVGQLLLVVQTDLSLPKDIDTIRIEALDEGVPKFRNDYQKLGTSDGEIKLPGTLALDAPPNASDAVTILVSARSGGLSGTVRLVREIVTTVPPSRVATLEVPLNFLCDGQAQEVSGDAASSCPAGQTCIAGSCTSDVVDSSGLPTYAESQVQTPDGSCFDATQCWDTPTVATVDMTTCSIPPVSNVNIALETQGEGICGPSGCFVTLDANSSPEGWTVATNGRILLPPAVCKQLGTQIVAVVTEPTTAACPSKVLSLPTCGPWSNSLKNPPAYTGPVALAGAQPRPTSVALVGTTVYWANAGVAGGAGSIRSALVAGGKIAALMTTSQAPRDLVVNGTSLVWTDAPAAVGMGSIYQLTNGSASQLVSKLDSPEGIALGPGRLFWSDFQGGIINTASTSGMTPAPLATGANYPYRLATDQQYVYWTNEGTASVMPPDGSIARYDFTNGTGTVEVVAKGQSVPRAIALDLDANGLARAIYWATFVADGAITRTLVTGGATSTLGMPEVIASGLAYPNGIALDSANIYWTNRGDGTVMTLAKGAPAGTAPTTLATAQDGPGSIAVDQSFVYWVVEGSSSTATGAVVKLPKGS